MRINNDLTLVIKKAKEHGWNDKSGVYIPGFIFEHDFAKSLWPDVDENIYWRMHLERMVLSDNPIQYLIDNTKEKV